MSQTNTSNTRDSEINNIGRDQVSLTTRDVIINYHYHFCSACHPQRLGPVAEATERSSLTGAGDRVSEETREEEGTDHEHADTGGLALKLWLRICRALCFR
ncbi:hypothetical protein FIBSPDRAFT_952767 [Athelia psychrophila]|uniref:Uncharacterized protein n=1 Tax=Athelia psychrophila TaxID=1759441 RepID=A0A166L7P8_9AGAM|nr:hypothetical protein FIBSPDRAFT_952767 [Fibularhizoctonia sp. CBS 109695]